MTKRFLPCVLALAAAVASIAQTTSPTPPPDPQADQALKDLLPRLASEDFQQRAGAQKDLEKLDYHALTALRRSAAEAADPEVKARLTERLQQLDEQYALEPPPISLTLKDTAWTGMITGLESALGPNRISGYGSGQFTLDVQEKPFWEVFRQLAAQNSFDFGSYMGQFSLSRNEKHPLKNFSISGPFIFAPLSLSRTATSDFQNGPAAVQPAPEFKFLIAADPRLLVIRYQRARLTSAVDDNNNELVPPPEKNGITFSPSAGGDFRWEQTATLAAVPNTGKKIVSAKGTFHVELALSTAEMTIDDPAERLNQEFTFQDRKITITKWEPREGNAGTIDFAYKVARQNESTAHPGNAMQLPPEAVFFYMVDADGKRIGQFVSILNGNSSLWLNGKLPVKLTVVVATKTKQLEVPFEFRDLAIP